MGRTRLGCWDENTVPTKFSVDTCACTPAADKHDAGGKNPGLTPGGGTGGSNGRAGWRFTRITAPLADVRWNIGVMGGPNNCSGAGAGGGTGTCPNPSSWADGLEANAYRPPATTTSTTTMASRSRHRARRPRAESELGATHTSFIDAPL